MCACEREDLVNSGVPGMILFVADDARSDDATRALLRLWDLHD